MKRIFLVLLWMLGTGLVQAGQDPIGFDGARHLLARTSFSANVAEIETYSKLTRDEAADRLLVGARQPPAPPPAWTAEPFQSPRRIRGMDEEARKAFRRQQVERGIELRAWWVGEMVHTDSPLAEKMVLFWHNHFVSSLQKVRSPQLMYRQNQLLREHALGNFGTLLHAVARDPAMLIYLDGVSNRKGKANENFARELMELFTLGEGRYSEADVRDAARAFTGWSIDGETGQFVYRSRQHDDGMKQVLGHAGNLDGEAVLDILLRRPETAEHITAKLWREFVSPEPDPEAIKRIAGIFRASGYQIRVVLREILVSDAFYSTANRGTLIKSPVDLVVGTLRQFDFSVPDTLPFVLALSQMGQNLFAPPNVKGWPGGEAWINSTTLLARRAVLERMMRADSTGSGAMRAVAMGVPRGGAEAASAMRARVMQAMAGVHFDSARWLQQFRGGDGAAVAHVLLATAHANPVPDGEVGRPLIRQLVQDPAYQLK